MAYYLYKELKPKTDPLSPENKLLFFIGPLIGLPAYSRHVVASKSPQTNTFSDSFAGYLRNIGSIDEMVSMGIMTDKVADIVKSESGELEVEQKTSLSEEKGRDSKKARAFQLFSQGKGPSSPEVKTLGLHKSTRFKYYNQYLTVHKP